MARHHIVPRSYLKAWTDPACPKGRVPFVHVYSRDGSQHRCRAPQNIFHERDLYIVETGDGSTSLRLERGLSQLESNFARIRRERLERRQPLDHTSYVMLLAFLAAMHQRTPTMMDHHLDFWRRVRKLGDELEANIARGIKPISGIGNSDAQSMTLDEVRRITDRPAANNLPVLISVELKALLRIVSVNILCTHSQPGFITSDAPAFWFDPEDYKRPPMMQGPALCYPTTEIMMPLSPRLCLFATPADHVMTYIDVDDATVQEINRRIRGFCRTEFVVSTDHVDPYWLDPGKVPDDGWKPRAA